MEKRIMLVDDDEDEYLILREALEMTYLQTACIYCGSAEQAFKELNGIIPDCILVDLNMPKINGLACISAIINRLKINSIPIIIYSTSISSELCLKAISAGAFGCIQKPKSIQKLAKVLSIFFSYMFTMPPIELVSKESDGNGEVVILQGKNEQRALLYIDK